MIFVLSFVFLRSLDHIYMTMKRKSITYNLADCISDINGDWSFQQFKINKSMHWLELNILDSENKNNQEANDSSSTNVGQGLGGQGQRFKIRITDWTSFRINNQSVSVYNTKKSIDDAESFDVTLIKIPGITDEQFGGTYSETSLEIDDLKLVMRFNRAVTVMRLGQYVDKIFNTLVEIDIVNGIYFKINHHDIVVMIHANNITLFVDNVTVFQTDYLSSNMNKYDKFADLKSAFTGFEIIFKYYDPIDDIFTTDKIMYYSEIMHNVLNIESESIQDNNPKRELLYDFLENSKENKQETKIMIPSKSFCQFIDYLQGSDPITEKTITEYMGILFHAVLYDCLELIKIDKKMLEYLMDILLDRRLYKNICNMYSQIIGFSDFILDPRDTVSEKIKEEFVLKPSTIGFIYTPPESEPTSAIITHPHQAVEFTYHSNLMKHRLDSMTGSSEELTLRKELFDFLESNAGKMNVKCDSNVHSLVKFLDYLQSNESMICIKTNNDILYVDILFNALRHGCIAFFQINGLRLFSVFLNVLTDENLYDTMSYLLWYVIRSIDY